ncbi:Nagst-1 protein [Aphelenchoides avenae]|nr:Nagst-1 protein [Aphelenchus avenae]
MVHYKFNYFDLRGLGEPIRLMFTYADQPFEDNRITSEQWLANLEKYKTELPYGRCPVLEVDGANVAESLTIARYLSKQLGLRRKEDLDEAKVESVADFHMDVWTATIPYFGTRVGLYTDKGDAETLREQVFLPAITKFLPVYVRKLKETGAFLTGKEVAWSDFIVAEFVTTLSSIDPEVLKDYPELVQFRDRVYGLPKIKEYIAKRPQSPL